jgi:hypothetical protein
MKKLNETSLKVGDIILTTTPHKGSKLIRAATKSDISHAMIYVADHSVIDATDEGVQARNTQRLLFDDESAIYVLRSRIDLPIDQVNEVCNYVRQRVGTEYTKTEAARSVLGGSDEWTKKQFCSRLVAQAYESVGVILVDDPNYCSPENIKNSPHLVVVEDASRAMSEKEAAYWTADSDSTQHMRDTINSVLAGARTKDASIQNLSDIDQHLVNQPEDDEFFCELFQRSGYLSLWESQRQRSPWLYDLDLMRSLPDPRGLFDEYARGTIDDENRGPNRFIINHGGYAMHQKVHPRRAFELLMNLHGVLATLHKQRVEVARGWLEHRGLLEPVATEVVLPHTAEWFSALEIWNPPQAMMTKAAIAARGGDTAVCSICADDPAADYQLPKEQRTPGGVYTLRLCDDCLCIRRERGEDYQCLP